MQKRVKYFSLLKNMQVNKEELGEAIKTWLKMDSEINQHKREIKEKLQQKKNVSIMLMNIMKSNHVDCFDVKNGSLVFKKNTIKKPLSGKVLMQILKDYFQDSPAMAENVTKHIMENREEQTRETLTLEKSKK
jgi:hypothetical protein